MPAVTIENEDRTRTRKLLGALSGMAVAVRQLGDKARDAARSMKLLYDQLRRDLALLSEMQTTGRRPHRGSRVMTKQARRVAYLAPGRTVRWADLAPGRREQLLKAR